jgi:hypothetical protein
VLACASATFGFVKGIQSDDADDAGTIGYGNDQRILLMVDPAVSAFIRVFAFDCFRTVHREEAR